MYIYIYSHIHIYVYSPHGGDAREGADPPDTQTSCPSTAPACRILFTGCVRELTCAEHKHFWDKMGGVLQGGGCGIQDSGSPVPRPLAKSCSPFILSGLGFRVEGSGFGV